MSRWLYDVVVVLNETRKLYSADDILTREMLTRWAASVSDSARLVVSREKVKLGPWDESKRNGWELSVIAFSQDGRKLSEKTWRAFALGSDLADLFGDGLACEIALTY